MANIAVARIKREFKEVVKSEEVCGMLSQLYITLYVHLILRLNYYFLRNCRIVWVISKMQNTRLKCLPWKVRKPLRNYTEM